MEPRPRIPIQAHAKKMIRHPDAGRPPTGVRPVPGAFSTIRSFLQHLPYLSHRARGERSPESGVQPPHLEGAFAQFGLPHLAVVARGRSPGALGVAEDVEPGEAPVAHEGEGLLEIRPALPGESDEHVREYPGLGKTRAQGFQPPGVERGGVPAPHAREDTLRAGLHGEVEGWAEPAPQRERGVEEAVGDVGDLQGGEADAEVPLEAGELFQHPREIHSGPAAVAEVAAQSYAAEHDLAITGAKEPAHLTLQGAVGLAGELRPDGGDDAVGAVHVAAVLNLDEGAAMPLEGADARVIRDGTAAQEGGDRVLVPVGDHVGRGGGLAHGRGGAGGQAPGDDEPGGRVAAGDAPKERQGVVVRLAGHRAGVDHAEVRGLEIPHRDGEAVGEHPLAQGLGLVLVDPAAEGLKIDAQTSAPTGT